MTRFLDEHEKAFVNQNVNALPRELIDTIMKTDRFGIRRPHFNKVTLHFKREIQRLLIEAIARDRRRIDEEHARRTTISNDVPPGFVRIWLMNDSSAAGHIMKTKSNEKWEVRNSSYVNEHPINADLLWLINAIPHWDQPIDWDDHAIKILEVYTAHRACSVSGYVLQLPSDFKGFLEGKTLRVPRGDRSSYKLLKDGKHSTLPYIHFKAYEQPEGTNCITHYLIETYNKNVCAAQIIAEKSIKKRMTVNPDGIPTYKELIDFVEKYKLNAKILDVFGRIMYMNDVNPVRKCLVLMLHENHIYEYTKPLTRSGKIDLERDVSISDLPRLLTSDKLEKTTPEDLVYFEFCKHLAPNFVMELERDQFPRPLMMDKRQGHNHICLDLKKAYYNAMYCSERNNRIPIFSVNDDIQPYSGDHLVAEWYYWTLSLPNPGGISITDVRSCYKNNMLTGYEAIYLHGINLLNLSEITHFKSCTAWVTAGNVMDKLDEVCTQTGVQSRMMFYNGVLGMCYNTQRFMQFQVHEESDLGLIMADPKGIDVIETDQSEWILKHTYGNRDYVEWNNRNIYSYVVSMCNINVMKLANLYIDRGHKVYRIWVDDVAVDPDTPVYPEIEDLIKLKVLSTNKTGVQGQNIIDMGRLVEEIRRHYASVCKRIKVITGGPGAGKTHKVRNEFDAQVMSAMTNVACRNMDTDALKADTMYTTFHLHDPSLFAKNMRKLSTKRMWIDEFSQLPNSYWSLIYGRAKHEESQEMVITGDMNQIPPVSGRIQYNSMFMTELMKKAHDLDKNTDGTERKGHRNSLELIVFRKFIINTDRGCLGKAMDALYSTNLDLALTLDTHICYTNQMRASINAEIQKRRNIKFNRVTGEVDIGTILTCVETCKRKEMYKMERYDVIGNTDGITLQVRGKQRIMKIKKADLKQFVLGYAITAHSAQGLTIKEKFAIYEISHMIQVDKEIFYTSVTRGIELYDIMMFQSQCGIKTVEIEEMQKQYKVYALDVMYDNTHRSQINLDSLNWELIDL